VLCMKDPRGWLLIGAVYERPKRLVTFIHIIIITLITLAHCV